MGNIISIKIPSETATDLANKVKTLRLNKKWSRKELATRAGINEYTLKTFETTGNISLKRLLAISFVLGHMSEFDKILNPEITRTIDDIIAQNKKQRKRGRKYKEFDDA